MRQSKAKQITNYIALFRKIVEGIYTSLSAKNVDIEGACSYLEMCQQRAIDFGTFIEGDEGEGHPTVKMLEDFCEVLYEIHEEIQSERGLSADSAKARLDTMVNRIEESANKDITITTVKLFLPYKASMWDSLESVWMKANEDPNCTAIVIPIPYFDKNPDGSVKQMHYEGNDYPDNVPVVSFENFDFMGVHPDEVYIHNPYDDWNYVTSVHPYFYTDNIKKFTDKLIYIPYFVLAEPDVDNPDVLESLKGYVLSKGVVNADEVIVQSENIKEQYINALKVFSGKETEDVWKNKITVNESLFGVKLDKPGKRMLFCIGANELIEHEDILIKSVSERLGILRESASKLSFSISLYPDDRSLWIAVNEQLSQELFDMIDGVTESEEFDKIHAKAYEADSIATYYDAYYGSPSPFAPAFIAQKKPVMIADLGLEI